MTKQYKIIGVVSGLVLAVGIFGIVWWTQQSRTSEQRATPSSGTTTSQTKPTPAGDATKPASSGPAAGPQAGRAGYYGAYSDDRLALGYDKTILFFHAPWCGECQAFDAAIRSGTVPPDVQILKVDYDTRQDLRQKYGVRIQSTFVELDDDDDRDNDHDIWVGYGKDKSINAILRNL